MDAELAERNMRLAVYRITILDGRTFYLWMPYAKALDDDPEERDRMLDHAIGHHVANELHGTVEEGRSWSITGRAHMDDESDLDPMRRMIRGLPPLFAADT